MTNPSCLIDLKHILPQTSWPQVIPALRQDYLIWKALQNPDFRGQALSRLGSHPDKWTPAQLSLLALEHRLNFSDICNKPLNEIDPELRVRAIQTYDIHNTDSPPEMDLPTAGLLMLALVEHHRLTHSWERLPQNEHWKTPLACLFGCLEQPVAFLLSLPVTLTVRILLSNPIDREKQLEYFFDILVAAPQKQRLSTLRNLAFQRPELSQQLARKLWKTSPQSSGGQIISGNTQSSLLANFAEIQALTINLNSNLAQAEVQVSAGYGQQADVELRSAWKTTQQLQTILLNNSLR